jgi:hypothetical protein
MVFKYSNPEMDLKFEWAFPPALPGRQFSLDSLLIFIEECILLFYLTGKIYGTVMGLMPSQ